VIARRQKARIEHRCAALDCPMPWIEPGERHVYAALAPWEGVNTSPTWWPLRFHDGHEGADITRRLAPVSVPDAEPHKVD
jgi:hypothetical protein